MFWQQYVHIDFSILKFYLFEKRKKCIYLPSQKDRLVNKCTHGNRFLFLRGTFLYKILRQNKWIALHILRLHLCTWQTLLSTVTYTVHLISSCLYQCVFTWLRFRSSKLLWDKTLNRAWELCGVSSIKKNT